MTHLDRLRLGSHMQFLIDIGYMFFDRIVADV
jgi:hypothetical protein